MAEEMSANYRLVVYFVSEFYRKRASELAHIASHNFTFQLHNLPDQNFTQFADRMGYISSKAKLVIGEIYTKDDVVFYAKSSVSIPLENGQKYVVHGLNTFIVKDGLLNHVMVKYELSDDEFVNMQQILANAKELEVQPNHNQDDIAFL